MRYDNFQTVWSALTQAGFTLYEGEPSEYDTRPGTALFVSVNYEQVDTTDAPDRITFSELYNVILTVREPNDHEIALTHLDTILNIIAGVRVRNSRAREIKAVWDKSDERQQTDYTITFTFTYTVTL